MEPNPEERPSIREQMNNVFKLRDNLQHEFKSYVIDGTVASVGFVVGVASFFPSERYLQIIKDIGSSYEWLAPGVVGIGLTGGAVGVVRMARMGLILNRMRMIQQDLRNREQETQADQ